MRAEAAVPDPQAGKTIVGMACLAAVQSSALVLTTNVTASRQRIAELLDKTTLQEDQIGEYNGASKEVWPITVATYQILTYRPRKEADFVHWGLFDERNWGLIPAVGAGVGGPADHGHHVAAETRRPVRPFQGG